MTMHNKWTRAAYRRERTREKLVASDRPRLSVQRSLKHLYAQVINPGSGVTVAAASSLSKEIKDKIKSGKNIETAKLVGTLVAQKAIAVGVKSVVFDRGSYLYHGRVKALAEAARAGGLEF